MNRTKLFSATAALGVGLGSLATAQLAHAVNFGDFMNPNRWFGGDRDRYYDDYGRNGRWGGPYGYGGGPYGWGGGPWGGYGGPWGGYGPWGGGYGPWGGYPGYGPGSTIVVTPQGAGGSERQAPPSPRLPE